MIALIIVLSVLSLILFLPIMIKISFTDKFDFDVKILGITVYEMKEKNKELDKYSPDQHDDSNKAFGIVKEVKVYFDIILEFLKTLYKYLKTNLIISEFDFNITFGFSDAAITGIVSGAIYTIVNTFYAYILNTFNVKKHSVDIKPDFENEHFKIGFLLRLRISIFWILCLLINERNAIDKLLKILKKDGVNDGRTSN